MKRGMWWPIGITGVLATTVAANIWVMAIANHDPSFAIEPDYYRKAITWDTTLAEARRSAALGWRLTPTLSPIDRSGHTTLTARLTDSSGVAIPGAVVHVSALAVARASDVQQATLAHTAGGEYSASIRAPHSGQWELRFEATLGEDRFYQTDRVDTYPQSAGLR